VAAAAFAVILVRVFMQRSDRSYNGYRPSASMKLPMVVLFVVMVFLGVYIPAGFSNMLKGIISSLGF
jgi:hypothetical protein